MSDFGSFLDDWLGAKVRGDAEAIRAGLSRRDGASAIGTEAGEWWAGADRFVEAHAGGRPLPVQIESVEAHESGEAGWVECGHRELRGHAGAGDGGRAARGRRLANRADARLRGRLDGPGSATG
jgi:hypothetical protein